MHVVVSSRRACICANICVCTNTMNVIVTECLSHILYSKTERMKINIQKKTCGWVGKAQRIGSKSCTLDSELVCFGAVSEE